MLAEISSFANTSGGYMFIGTTTYCIPNNPKSIRKNIDKDATTQQIIELVRNGIEPEISNVQIKFVDKLDDDNIIISIFIPVSWKAPHMIRYKGSLCCFNRKKNVGRCQMGVYEIKTALDLFQKLPENLKRFRNDRSE